MGTKPESGPTLLRSSSFAMGHVHSKDLSNVHYAELMSIAPVGLYIYYKREN